MSTTQTVTASRSTGARTTPTSGARGTASTGAKAAPKKVTPQERAKLRAEVLRAAKAHTSAAAPAQQGPSLTQEIQNQAVNWEPLIAILFFVALVFMMWRMMKVMPRVKPQQIKPTSDQSVTFADIAGVDDAKAELQEIVEFLREPKSFQALGAKVPKGILLHGPPGTGKTLLAKAVANESGAQFFAQSAASFVEMFAGLGAARIRRLFAIARKHEPAIIFIDELDAVGGQIGRASCRERV